VKCVSEIIFSKNFESEKNINILSSDQGVYMLPRGLFRYFSIFFVKKKIKKKLVSFLTATDPDVPPRARPEI